MWYRFVLCTLNPMLFILHPLSLQSDHISFERSSAFQYIFVPRLQFFSRFRKFSVCVSYFVCQGCLELCLLILGMIRLLAFNEWNQTKVQWREEALPSEYNIELRRSFTVAQSYTALPRISFLFPTYSRDERVIKRKTSSYLSCEQRAQHAWERKGMRWQRRQNILPDTLSRWYVFWLHKRSLHTSAVSRRKFVNTFDEATIKRNKW